MAPNDTYPNQHPLDPLTPREIEQAREIVDQGTEVTDDTRFIEITLAEPPKDALREFEQTDASPVRQARVIVRDKGAQRSYKGIASLDEEDLIEWTEIERGQPRMIGEEFVEVEEAVTSNPEFREAVQKRGADPDLAIVTAWSAGYDFVPEDIDRSRRLAHGIAWVNATDDDEGAEAYNRPLSGIHAWVDLDDREVIKIVDTGPKNTDVVNNLKTHYYREDKRDLRDDLKPYNVIQPEGPSWEVDGNTVEWQKWHVRVGFNHREGLVLYNIGYDDDGEERSILRRASWPEVITAYNDSDPDHDWKAPFDVGEYGIGRLANSLTEGCDCLGYMHYWDALLSDGDGEPQVIPNAICLHEEDYGTLWRHHDWRIDDDEVRRNRRLVISFISTIGNYDFAFYWYFYQDGSIEGQVRLTGCNATGLLETDQQETGYAEMVGPGHKSMLHQHVFNCRLDFELDGQRNTVREVNLKSVDYGPDGYDPTPHAESDRMRLNPHGNAAYVERTRFEREKDAQRMTNTHSGRYWEIINENVLNEATASPVGYRLRGKSGTNTAFAMQPGSSMAKRAGFAKNHLWVTQHADEEIHPAGEYPNQNSGGEGLPSWTAENRPIANEDVVVWYNMCQTHVGVPEDWPVLPVKMLSFKLEPAGFFKENPSIDVPPEHAIKNVEQWKTENQESMDFNG
ncbi:primary-amine oxidase [Halalkalicoccus subterraneus]|uniref:primary-amine oxidase n=1 Tax=Halalkalicoccus subterraneus TaxID=2675002 RepID=UPI000EFAB988|nr:primary-amine oxidase [Halalkalicoccus subterraneus]